MKTYLLTNDPGSAHFYGKKWHNLSVEYPSKYLKAVFTFKTSTFYTGKRPFHMDNPTSVIY